MSTLHLGIDYGTSASKLVLTNLDSVTPQRRYLLKPDGSMRYSSGITFDQERIFLRAPEDDLDSLRSLKMRFAEELTGEHGKHFWGKKLSLPPRISTEDLITLTIWRLLSIGYKAAADLAGDDEFTMGFTVGIPMSFLDRPKLKTAYLRIARVASELLRFGPLEEDEITIDRVINRLAMARNKVNEKPPIKEGNIRNWLRSETEASMYWTAEDPSTPSGPYFCVDIGAGTTDVSAIMIKQIPIQKLSDSSHERGGAKTWKNNEFVFFGAHSAPYAVEYFRTLNAAGKLSESLDTISTCITKTAGQAYPLISKNQYTLGQWKNASIMLLGGGSKIDALKIRLTQNPISDWRSENLKRFDPIPPDFFVTIDGRAVTTEEQLFATVAFGLAERGARVLTSTRPGEVQSVQELKNLPFVAHEEIYG